MEIVERESLTVVGLPVHAAREELWETVPRAWQQFFGRHTEIAHSIGEGFIDVSLEKNEGEYLQLVGSQVSPVERIPQGMKAVEIPTQRYIYHEHAGPVEDIARSFGAMYGWAQQQGYDAGGFKPDIGYTTRGDEREHDLFIGLLPENGWRDLQAP